MVMGCHKALRSVAGIVRASVTGRLARGGGQARATYIRNVTHSPDATDANRKTADGIARC